jgi:hypothetical protein
MDSMDVIDLAKILAMLVKVEAMRGANEARAARGEAMAYPVESFDEPRVLAEQALGHMEWCHNED